MLPCQPESRCGISHDIFISYSNRDAQITEQVCRALEENDLQCWIAPRNITPGVKYAAALVEAITSCKVFLLILSKDSNDSPQVEMEVDRAASKNKPILCFRIDDVVLSQSLEYYLSSRHWLDASKPPLEKHIQNLVKTIRDLVHGSGGMDSTGALKVTRLTIKVNGEEALWENLLVMAARGREEVGGREVLITRIRARLVSPGDFLARFEPVARALGKVETTHLARILDYGEQDGRAALVEEAPAGRSLAERTAGGETLSQDTVLDIATQLTETLAALHKRNILQLFFDPQNIWLGEDGSVRVSSTGVAQGADVGKLVAKGKMPANPWQAPEVRHDEPADMRSDLFSLGAVLYLALTGKEPSLEASDTTTPVPDNFAPSSEQPDLAPEWDDLVNRCLQSNPNRRIQSAAEFMSRLEDVRRGMEMAGDTPTDRAEDTLVGQTLGGYQLVEKLGRGGMATVYKAYESALDRYVAVKILPSLFAGEVNFAQRFKREAKAVAHLSHPNIIPIYSYGEEKGITYIAMQLMQGGTLKHPHGHAMDPKKALEVLAKVTRALAYAHQRGIVHRDVKPGNILLTEEGWPVIADFGLVQMAEASARLTSTGLGLGTPAYMSPEQGQGGRVDARSDIYSLGIVLYEMVTGDVPFHADTPMAVLLKQISEPMPKARKVNPDIPKEVEGIILKAAAKDPADRYQSADEMAEAMEQALAQMTSVKAAVVERKSRQEKPREKKEQVEKPQREKPSREAVKRKTLGSPVTKWKVKPGLLAGAAAGLVVLVLAGIFGLPKLLHPGTVPPGTVPTGQNTPANNVGIHTVTALSTLGPAPIWQRVNEMGDLGRDQVTAIAINPNNNAEMLLGTQYSGIYRSTNGGDSWEWVGAGLDTRTITSLMYDPARPGLVYAGVFSGDVYKSTDGGISWQLSLGVRETACQGVYMDPNTSDVFISDGKNIFITRDGGDNWAKMMTDLPEGTDCNVAWQGSGPDTIFASVRNNGFFHTTKDTDWKTWLKWEPWASLLPDIDVETYRMTIDPYESGQYYVTFVDRNTTTAHLLLTNNGGRTWTDTPNLYCIGGMLYSKRDTQREYCVTSNTLATSTDNGNTWSIIREFTNYNDFIFTSAISESETVYLGMMGLNICPETEKDCTRVSEGLGSIPFEFLADADPNRLWVRANDVTGWRLLVGNENGSGEMELGEKFANLPAVSPGDVPFLGSSGEFYKSSENTLWKFNFQNNLWDKIISVDSDSEIHFMEHPYKIGIFFGTGDASFLFRTFKLQEGNWEENAFAVEGAGAGRLFSVQGDENFMMSATTDVVYLSQDMGEHWTPCRQTGVPFPDSSTAIAIDPRLDNGFHRVYLVTRGKGIFISSDNCQTDWKQYHMPFSSGFFNSVILDPANLDIVYAAGDGGVYVSYDRGETWNDLMNGLDASKIVYELYAVENRVYAATPFGLYKLETR